MSSLRAVQGWGTKPINSQAVVPPWSMGASGCPQRCPLENSPPAWVPAPASSLPPRARRTVHPQGGGPRPFHPRQRNHFASKLGWPTGEEGWRVGGKRLGMEEPAASPLLLSLSRSRKGLPDPPSFPPRASPPPPSPGHGCRSSWTTVTLVRTTSRFDMAS